MERAINFAETEDNHKEAWVKIISQMVLKGGADWITYAQLIMKRKNIR